MKKKLLFLMTLALMGWSNVWATAGENSKWYLWVNGNDAVRFKETATANTFIIEKAHLSIAKDAGYQVYSNDETPVRYGYSSTDTGEYSTLGDEVTLASNVGSGENGWFSVGFGTAPYTVTFTIDSENKVGKIIFEKNPNPKELEIWAYRNEASVKIGTFSPTNQAEGTYEGQVYLSGWEHYWITAVYDDKARKDYKSGSNNSITDTGDNFWATSSTAGIYDLSFDFSKATDAWTNEYNSSASSCDLTVTTAGYATFYSDFAFVMPAGLTGCYFNAVSDGTLTKGATYAAGVQVPRATALLVSGDANTYPITFNGDLTATPADNLLHGGNNGETPEDNDENYYYYKLSYKESGDNLGWYWGTESTGAAFKNGKNKAYLKLSKASFSGARRSYISLFGDITGIENVEAVAEAKAQEGKFFENGKLVIVKNGKKFNANGARIY